MKKYILFENSNTQRVVLIMENSDTVLICKEWRRTDKDDWNGGKGITLPKDSFINLGGLLSCTNEQHLEDILTSSGIQEVHIDE